MKYKLLVLDIDGTTADSQKNIAPEIRDALIGLQDQGVRVVLASGRPPEGVFPVAEYLELARYGSYILAFNGGKIMEAGSRTCIFDKRLPGYLPRRLWEDAVKHGIGMAAYREGVIAAGTEPDSYMELESRITGMPIRYPADFSGSSGPGAFSVNECLLTGHPDELEALEPYLSYKYFHEAQVFHSEPWYLEVAPKQVDKAYGLKYLLRHLNIPKEAMVCCGDSYNDIRMLQYAGVGVAMANAPENVKLFADYVTERDNDHLGVAEVVERFF